VRRLVDGRLAIAGQFTSYAGVARGRIAILNADGTVAAGFDPGEGLVGTSSSATANTIAERKGGSLVVGGNFTTASGVSRNRIAAYNLDGTLAADFNPGGGFTAPVNVIAVQSDGRLLVGGSFNAYNGDSCPTLVRLGADGTRDATFHPGGLGPDAPVYAIAPGPDGRIMISGAFSTYNGVSRPGVARLLATGDLDESFVPAGGGVIPSLLLQEDGRVLLRGAFTALGLAAPREFLARLNADGSLDESLLAAGLNASSLVPSTMALRDNGELLLHNAGNNLQGTSGFAAMRAAAPPSISTLSSSTTVFAGGSVTLTVVASGTLPAVYQWYRDGTLLRGANSPQLTLTAVSAADAGIYTVSVSSELGTVISTGVTLTVNGAPTFLVQPASRSVM